MLDVLVLSHPQAQVKPLGGLGSFFVHTIILALAVEISGHPSVIHRGPIADTTLVFLHRLSPPEVRPLDEPQKSRPDNLVIATDPPPKGFQTVLAPKDIPTTVPPVDLTTKPLDPRDFTGRGVEGGVARGVVGGTGKVDNGPASDDVVYLPTTDDARFEPAVLLSQPPPKYPPVLRDIGLSGRVLIQFTVNTTGRVDSASIEVLQSTNEGFEAPARESVAGAIFRPAHLNSQPVRQRAQQPIRFIATR